MIPSERAAQLIASLQDQYGNYHVPPSEIVKVLQDEPDLLRKMADERWLVPDTYPRPDARHGTVYFRWEGNE